MGAAAEHALGPDQPAGAAKVRGVFGPEFFNAADLGPVLRAIEPVECDRSAIPLGRKMKPEVAGGGDHASE